MLIVPLPTKIKNGSCHLALAGRFVQDKERGNQSGIDDWWKNGFVVQFVSNGPTCGSNQQASSCHQLWHGSNPPKGKSRKNLAGTQNQEEGLGGETDGVDKVGGHVFERFIHGKNPESHGRVEESREDGGGGEGLDNGLCFWHGGGIKVKGLVQKKLAGIEESKQNDCK